MQISYIIIEYVYTGERIFTSTYLFNCHSRSMYMSNTETAQQQHSRTRQADIYFIDRKKVITDLFFLEMKEIYVGAYMYIQDC